MSDARSKLEEMLARPLPKRQRPQAPKVVPLPRPSVEQLHAIADRAERDAAKQFEEEIRGYSLRAKVGACASRLERVRAQGKPEWVVREAERALQRAEDQFAASLARFQEVVDRHGSRRDWHEEERRRLETIKLGFYSY